MCQRGTQMNYLPGDFSFIQDSETRIILADLYWAVCQTDTWNLMREEPKGGYMFTTDERYNYIKAAMTYPAHSGASYGWTMRSIQFIAQKGWNAFFERMIKITKVEAEEAEDAEAEDPIN